MGPSEHAARPRGGERRGAQAGFSLLEVLVALMILALAMTVAFRLFSEGLRNLTLSGQNTRAAMLAESTGSESSARFTARSRIRSALSRCCCLSRSSPSST